MDASQEYYENCVDDNSFYAELTKQILLLTTDDEQDDFINYERRRSFSSATKRCHNTNGSVKSLGRYYDWTKVDEANNSVPSWLLNLWRNGNINGTGVFIPNIDVKSQRRSNKPRRRKNEKAKMYKPVSS